MVSVNIRQKAAETAYQEVLFFVARYSTQFYLVDQFKVCERGSGLMQRLRPFLIGRQLVSEWPGTRMGMGRTGTIPLYSYEASPLAVRTLGEGIPSLYMGADLSKQMVLPEDLGFLRADGSILLASISHEHDAWLELAASEYQDLIEVQCRIGFQLVDELS